MAQTIKLHGGPWHGRVVAVEDGRDHIHILAPAGPLPALTAESAETPASVPTNEGTYSKIGGKPGHFEWDGWVTHD